MNNNTRNMGLFGGGMALAGAGLAAVFMMSHDSADEAAVQTAQAAPAKVVQAAPQAQKSAPVSVQHKQVCASCGVVESVNPVTVKGQGTGAGAVVGGVLGGVVGNQMGGGSGRTAMTVLGAVGGGLAGNEVEKRTKSNTVYDVRVRMDDGSTRTLQLANAPVARGDRVSVDGANLRRL